jgi:hypothetical protein
MVHVHFSRLRTPPRTHAPIRSLIAGGDKYAVRQALDDLAAPKAAVGGFDFYDMAAQGQVRPWWGGARRLRAAPCGPAAIAIASAARQGWPAG